MFQKFILDVARFLGPSLTVQLLKRHAILLLNITFSNLEKLWLGLSLTQQSLIYGSCPDRNKSLRMAKNNQTIPRQIADELFECVWPYGFLNIFHVTLLFFHALFKRWINNKLEVKGVIFTSCFLSYSILLYYTQLKHDGSNT